MSGKMISTAFRITISFSFFLSLILDGVFWRHAENSIHAYGCGIVQSHCTRRSKSRWSNSLHWFFWISFFRVFLCVCKSAGLGKTAVNQRFGRIRSFNSPKIDDWIVIHHIFVSQRQTARWWWCARESVRLFECAGNKKCAFENQCSEIWRWADDKAIFVQNEYFSFKLVSVYLVIACVYCARTVSTSRLKRNAKEGKNWDKRNSNEESISH